MRCLRIIVGGSWREKRYNTSIRRLAKLQRLLTTLTQCRLCFLAHLLRMADSHLLKQLLMCAPIGGNWSVGSPEALLEWSGHEGFEGLSSTWVLAWAGPERSCLVTSHQGMFWDSESAGIELEEKRRRIQERGWGSRGKLTVRQLCNVTFLDVLLGLQAMLA